MVDIELELDVQATEPVMAWFAPSLYWTLAVYCWIPPATRVDMAGVVVMEVSAAAVIVITADGDVFLRSLEVMFLEPVASAVARPLEPSTREGIRWRKIEKR